MYLWLMRHGEAVSADEAVSDFERALSAAGRQQVSRLGSWLKTRVAPPDLILHSPLRRTCETAQRLREELGGEIPCQASGLLAPGLRCDELLKHLSAGTSERVVCIGHMPDISRCLAEMLGGGRFAIAPGTIAGIEFPHIITPGGGLLRWMLPPEWF